MPDETPAAAESAANAFLAGLFADAIAGRTAGINREPRADFRTGAAAAYELYVAYQEAGFTQSEALTLLVGQMRSGQ